ncbi:MAG TPA: hypothetical protein VLE97_08935 [Gaiellaceae bacterium]|nr:hypothetical protein [Gaiellaceae bacterium]
MTGEKFQVVGGSLVGRGLSFDVAPFGASDASKKEFDDALASVAEVAYRQGRDSVLLPYDDRFDLHCTVEALRALSVIVGPSATGDRYRRSADIIARLLQAQGPDA